MKRKNRFQRFLALALASFMGSMTMFLSGCVFPSLNGGNWINNANEQLESGEIDQEEYDKQFKEQSGGIELDGVKVLRRPSSYDYDGQIVDGRNNEILPNDYYIYFANDIFENLYRIYGIVNEGFQQKLTSDGTNIFDEIQFVKPNNGVIELNTIYSSEDPETHDNLKYFYDAIRYQITDVSPPQDNGTPSDPTDDYYIVTANTSKGWKWSFDAFKGDGTDLLNENGEDLNSFVYSDIYSYTANKGTIVDNTKIQNVFAVNDFALDAIAEYYTPMTYYSNEIVKSDFIYTLGYAIYCMVLEMFPNSVGFRDGEWVVEGYNAEKDNSTGTVTKSSARVAFEDMKAKFEKNGSYVGLTSKNKASIKNYILNKIIGEDALVYGEQDLYYEDVVDAVVEYCGYLTTTGQSGQGISHIGQSYIASEIMDYPGTSFFVSQNEYNPFEGINSYEYQSLVLMPKEEMKLTDIWLDFMYTARDPATGEPIDDPELFIKIYVTIRWFDGSQMHECQQSIVVKNGYYDPAIDGSLMFELDAKPYGVNENGLPESFGSVATVGKFVCDDIDVSNEKYAEVVKPDEMLPTLNYLTITGAVDARNYYEVVNGTSGYGSYGRLKSDKVGVNNMSYIEITFDVVKSDYLTLNRNYDFYVGFSNLHYEEPEELERWN